MSLRLQICIAVIIIVLFIAIVNMIRREKIDLRYALSWMVLCFVALILDAFPGILEWMADALGIALPSNMVFIVAILLLTITIYSLTASVSRLSAKNKRLTQEMALLREEMERMKADHD